MNPDNSLILAAFGAMGTVITVMWQKLSAENARLNNRADRCEADREKLFQAVAELSGDRELLERCPAPRCPLRPKDKPSHHDDKRHQH